MIFKRRNLGGSTGKVHRYLFEEIIYNRLKPGSALSEAEIAAALNISRTPVREALMILESEGIITRYPSRGCFVARITVRDVEEIFELRSVLEVQALRNSIGRIQDKQLTNLEKRLEALTPESPQADYFAADRELHGLLYEYCGNSRLVDFLGILNAQIERVRVISAGKPSRLTQSRREHLGLVLVLARRDLPAAEKLLVAHINNVRDSALEVCKHMAVSYA
ncbi:MAG: GntR family transcriptional regulator [Planctomycetota bacterium]|nr:GntR family transcriptional regulator [Planctomycetota bacterium]